MDSDTQEIAEYLKGKTLIKISHSPQIKGESLLEGLGIPYYFSTVIQIENGEQFEFGRNWIVAWVHTKRLMEVTHQNWQVDCDVKFKGLKINEVFEDEDECLVFRLENDTIFYHDDFYGNKLFIQNYSDAFDENGDFL